MIGYRLKRLYRVSLNETETGIKIDSETFRDLLRQLERKTDRETDRILRVIARYRQTDRWREMERERQAETKSKRQRARDGETETETIGWLNSKYM